MIATVPSNIQIARESYYHSLMLLWMRLVGFEARGEESNNLGRSDIVWQQPNLAVVAEIKFHAKMRIDTLLKKAMTQIHEKRYYNKYTGKVLLLGFGKKYRLPNGSSRKLKLKQIRKNFSLIRRNLIIGEQENE